VNITDELCIPLRPQQFSPSADHCRRICDTWIVESRLSIRCPSQTRDNFWPCLIRTFERIPVAPIDPLQGPNVAVAVRIRVALLLPITQRGWRPCRLDLSFHPAGLSASPSTRDSCPRHPRGILRRRPFVPHERHSLASRDSKRLSIDENRRFPFTYAAFSAPASCFENRKAQWVIARKRFPVKQRNPPLRLLSIHLYLCRSLPLSSSIRVHSASRERGIAPSHRNDPLSTSPPLPSPLGRSSSLG